MQRLFDKVGPHTNRKPGGEILPRFELTGCTPLFQLPITLWEALCYSFILINLLSDTPSALSWVQKKKGQAEGVPPV